MAKSANRGPSPKKSNKVPSPILEIRDLTKSYIRPSLSFGKKKESVPAVRGLDLLVRKGDSFALLGLNGQGKSTTVRTILGLSKPDSGTVQLFGIPLTWTEKDTVLRQRIGYLSENVPFPPYLTVDEVLRYHARLMGYKGKSASHLIKKALEAAGLQVLTRRFSELSKGMAQRAGLAVALLGDPEFLILDEPLSGLDPLGCRNVRDVLKHFRSKGKTVLFTSHILSEVQKTANRVGIIDQGRMVKVLDIPKDLGKESLEEHFLRAIKAKAAA